MPDAPRAYKAFGYPWLPAKFLGDRESRGTELLSAAAAISVPFDLSEGSKRLEGSRMGRLYARYFLRSLQAKARAKRELLGDRLDMKRVLNARTLREFDDAATAPLHGFADAAEYYRDASSGPLLEEIRVPTFLLQSLDDPFLPEESVPMGAISSNPWLIGATPSQGGHVGFVEKSPPWRPKFWAEAEAARYLAHVLLAGGAS
jgi:predicted alpha/beta-fold hydrolase